MLIYGLRLQPRPRLCPISLVSFMRGQRLQRITVDHFKNVLAKGSTLSLPVLYLKYKVYCELEPANDHLILVTLTQVEP